jgi:ATP synthase F0 subunit c
MLLDAQATIELSAYVGAGMCIGLGAIGAALGEGFTAGLATQAIAGQSDRSGDVIKNMLVGQAIAESAAIFALVVAVLLLFMDFSSANNIIKAACLLGAGISMGFGAIGSGIGAGYPGGECCNGIGRQPEVAGRLTTNMLIGSAVCQTPAIFSMVIALMLMFMDFGNMPLSPGWAAMLGAGMSTGLAAIGSGMGGGLAAGESCAGIARNPETVGPVTTNMLIGQAVCQTPSIFGLLVSFILMFRIFPEAVTLAPAMALLGAGLSMGFGGIGPGFGNGIAAAEATKWVARNVSAAGELTRTMLVAQAVSQSTAIYAMVVSLVLIFVV